MPARSGSEPMHRLATSPGSDHWKLEVGAEGGGHGRVRMVLVMFIIMTWEMVTLGQGINDHGIFFLKTVDS